MVNKLGRVFAIAVLMLSACGSDDGGDGNAGGEEASGSAPEPTDVAVDEPVSASAPDGAQESVDDLAESLETAQGAAGGGGATFTANGQTWEFPNLLCAFGEDQIGQTGAVFNMSAIGDGLQLYASIDDSGALHSLSLNDIENIQNPSVALTMDSFVTSLVGSPAEFLVLDGKQVSADIKMIDETVNRPTSANAQLTATCP